MKKIITIIIAILISAVSFSQPYFQGTVVKDPANATNKRIIFRMNPTATITTAISYIEIAFRYPTATTPPFSIDPTTGIITNTVTFPGLNIQRLPDFLLGGYTYVKFVHNTGTIASTTYTSSASGYDIFSVALTGPNATIPQIEMSSDVYGTDDYVFGVVNGAGVLINPGAGNQLYGPGFYISGNNHLLPLNNIALPVKFNDFTATKKGNDGILDWSVENESNITDRYEIERSFNGRDFKGFSTISPKNNGLSANAYTLIDFDLTRLNFSGFIYYRIKQIDQDGKFAYSVIRSIVIKDNEFAIGVYPNPVKDVTMLRFNLLKDEPVSVILIDAQGKQVQQIQIQGLKGINNKTIDMARFANGTYQLVMRTASDIKTVSIIKN